MILSILIPSIDDRFDQLRYLMTKLKKQIGDRDVEMISFIDNRKRTIGEKRENMINSANGDYICFIDDDDDVANNFIERVLTAIDHHSPDVITFDQLATIDGDPFIVNFSLKNNNEPAERNEDGNLINIKRKPFHMCIWKRDLVKDCKFPHITFGEDAEWIECAITKVQKEHHINEILHYYKFSSSGSTTTI